LVSVAQRGNRTPIVGVVDTRHQFGGVWHLYVWVMVVVGVLVFAATLLPLVLYHRSRRGDGPGSRTDKASVAESIYVLALAAIVAVFVAKTFRTESRIDAVAATGDVVQVTAFKWGWTFRHDGRTVSGDDLDPPTLEVPAGRTIRFRMTSRDVIHAFWVPSLRFKRDAFPERTTEFDLVFRKGTAVGRCAEFCGLQHAGMTFLVRAT
jgi:cytochrome c oxidase subunit II